MLKRVVVGLAALASVLLVVDTGVWLWATARIAQQLAAWEAAQLDYGLHVLHAEPSRSGWPFAAALVVPQVSVAAETPGSADGHAPGVLAWQAERVTLALTLLAPATLAIVPSGAQRLSAGAQEPLALRATRLELLLPLTGELATLEASGLQVEFPAGVFGVRQGTLHIDATHLAFTLDGVTLPIANLPFGGSIASVSAQGSTTVGVPFAPDLRSAAAAWRDAGGRLTLDHASIHWGPLDAEGTAAAAFDAALQPMGTANLRLTGYGDLIEAMTRAGAITRNDARVAATLLGLMAHPLAGGGSAVDLPLTLQDGRVAVGAIPLTRVPRLALP